MSRVSLIILSLFAVLAASAVVSAPASATLETRYFVENKELKGEEEAEGTIGAVQINFTFVEIKLMVECKRNTVKEYIVKGGGESFGKYELKECTLYEIKEGVRTEPVPACPILEPIEDNFKDLLISGPGGVVEDEFKPSTGGALLSIDLRGPLCVIKSSEFPLAGTYVASFGAEGEVEKLEHELVATSIGSGLSVGARSAALISRTTLKIKGSKSWYVD